MKRRLASVALAGAALAVCVRAAGEDVRIRAAGPVGIGYVGIFYGLAHADDGTWYVGSDLLGDPSLAWMGVVDTGSSACVLGTSTQAAYTFWDGTGIPLRPYPEVTFADEGFGGSVDFAVTEPLRLMIADFKTAHTAPDPEAPDLYTAYGPVGAPEPPSIHMAAALEPIGGALIDVDIIGMSVLEGRTLQVDPHYLESLRLFYVVMAGSLTRPAPAPTNPRALFVPVTLEEFFTEPQPVEVGRHPMLAIHVRHGPGDGFATRTAIFDSGSPVNFVSESFAQAGGVDTASTPDLIIPVGGAGGQQNDSPGWYVDALALDLGAGRAGDQLVFSNTAVFVIPDAQMPGGLDAILGSGIVSPSMDFQDTPVLEWYVDTSDPENAHIIVVLPEPGDVTFDGRVGIDDLTIVARNWGLAPAGLPDGDLSGDAAVGRDDLIYLAMNWSPAPLISGDVNRDGRVDLDDLTVVARNWGMISAGWGDGDLTGDGTVGRDDMLVVAVNWTGPAPQAVPEPAAACLLAAAGVVLLRRRGRRGTGGRQPRARPAIL